VVRVVAEGLKRGDNVSAGFAAAGSISEPRHVLIGDVIVPIGDVIVVIPKARRAL